jgi:diguanylate cyclase (GGDEF)-like protein
MTKLFASVTSKLPTGWPLAPAVWESRHRVICRLLWLHVPVLFIVGVATHHPAFHVAQELAIVVGATGLASWPTHSRRFRSCTATFALFVCSALLVHFTHGNVEMHFHFFVMVGVISMYHDWVPFLTGLGFVVLHHGAMGAIDAASVYNHPAAQRNPWLWALVHGTFVLAASSVHVMAWRLNEDQTLKDPLTRLANRTLFFDRLAHALARRARSDHNVVVLFLDLDGFKAVNDTLGHPTGDLMLVEVSNRLALATRDADTTARLGGDEFAILLDTRGEQDASAVASRILRELREPMNISGHELFANASIGMVVVDEDLTVDEVVRNADLAMYMAKASGRGRVERFEPHMHHRAVERVQLEADLRFAISNGEVEVHYQPTVTLEDGRIVGFEALARWNHPTRGQVPPTTFIPIAEASALINELGLYVLRTACAQAATWRRAYPKVEISVNVSPLQLKSDRFLDELHFVLASTGLEPSALVLELTENVLMQDADEMVTRLNAIKTLGVRLAIDDFGTGHSSLSYLRKFPIDVLKIVRSFVESLTGSGAELASTIVRLGELLRLNVIAEGVEVEAQRLELRALGCAQGQGYLFARAQTAHECTELLNLSSGPDPGVRSTPAAG